MKWNELRRVYAYMQVGRQDNQIFGVVVVITEESLRRYDYLNQPLHSLTPFAFPLPLKLTSRGSAVM